MYVRTWINLQDIIPSKIMISQRTNTESVYKVSEWSNSQEIKQNSDYQGLEQKWEWELVFNKEQFSLG